jgi:hypothetical protein
LEEDHTLDISRQVKAPNLQKCLERPIKFFLRNVAHDDIPVPSDQLNRVCREAPKISVFNNEEDGGAWLQSNIACRWQMVERFSVLVASLDKLMNLFEDFIFIRRLSGKMSVYEERDYQKQHTTLECVRNSYD